MLVPAVPPAEWLPPLHLCLREFLRMRGTKMPQIGG